MLQSRGLGCGQKKVLHRSTAMSRRIHAYILTNDDPAFSFGIMTLISLLNPSSLPLSTLRRSLASPPDLSTPQALTVYPAFGTQHMARIPTYGGATSNLVYIKISSYFGCDQWGRTRCYFRQCQPGLLRRQGASATRRRLIFLRRT